MLLDALFCFNSYSYESIIKIIKPSQKASKKSAYGRQPILFSTYCFVWVLGDVTSVTTPLYIFVLVFVPTIASKERETNLWLCCPEADFRSSLFEIPNNYRASSVAEIFLQQATGFFLPFSSFTFSYLRSRSTPTKIIFTVCSVFDRLCLSFALLLLRSK